MQQMVEDGVRQFQSLSKPKRYVLIAALWLFTIAVVTLIQGFVPAVIASTVAVSFVYLIEPYRARHPSKGILALLLSLLDVRRPSRGDFTLATVGAVVIVASELLFALILGTLATQDTAGHGVASAAQSSPSIPILAALFLSAAVIAPAMEELVFRNGLQKLLALRIGDIAAIGVTSGLFTVLHVPAYGGFGVPLSALALPLSVVFTGSVVFGTLYWRTGNVVTAMLSHGLFNGVVLSYSAVAPLAFA